MKRILLTYLRNLIKVKEDERDGTNQITLTSDLHSIQRESLGKDWLSYERDFSSIISLTLN